jgi:hypothetical protein
MIAFYLTCAGATIIFTSGKIFQPLHRWLNPNRGWSYLECELCLGFAVGALMSMLWHVAGLEIPVGYNVVGVFSNGCTAAIVTYIIGRTFTDEGIKIAK